MRERNRVTGSSRDIKAKRDQSKKSVKGLMKYYDFLLNKLDDNKPLNPQESVFFKKYDELLSEAEARQNKLSKDDTKEFPDGKLKRFLEMFEWTSSICKNPDEVIESTGYYKCNRCGNLHLKGRECMYIEYQNLSKSNEKSLDLEDDSMLIDT